MRTSKKIVIYINQKSARSKRVYPWFERKSFWNKFNNFVFPCFIGLMLIYFLSLTNKSGCRFQFYRDSKERTHQNHGVQKLSSKVNFPGQNLEAPLVFLGRNRNSSLEFQNERRDKIFNFFNWNTMFWRGRGPRSRKTSIFRLLSTIPSNFPIFSNTYGPLMNQG